MIIASFDQNFADNICYTVIYIFSFILIYSLKINTMNEFEILILNNKKTICFIKCSLPLLYLDRLATKYSAVNWSSIIAQWLKSMCWRSWCRWKQIMLRNQIAKIFRDETIAQFVKMNRIQSKIHEWIFINIFFVNTYFIEPTRWLVQKLLFITLA